MLLLDHRVVVYVLPETICPLLHHAFHVRLEPSLRLMDCLVVPNALLARIHPPLDYQAVHNVSLTLMHLQLDYQAVFNVQLELVLHPLDPQVVPNVLMALLLYLLYV